LHSKLFCVQARVPTNIAFLKYWGKSDAAHQWPANDSISMTLDLGTVTKASPAEHTEILDAQGNSLPRHFVLKPLKHIEHLQKLLSFSEPLQFRTHNEFPASCGIASSASGLGALTLAAIAAWTRSSNFDELASKGFGLERLADLARLGSGSACRSFWGGMVHWQRSEHAASQMVAPIANSTSWALRDAIVILDANEKSISSSDGHRAAWTSPQFSDRLARLPQRTSAILEAIAVRDIDRLGPLLEVECLEMHNIAATSEPPIHYISDATRAFLSYWDQHGPRNAYYTIDAGPNVHIIYEEAQKDSVARVLAGYRYLDTKVGHGPELSVVL
jgi:diphosphomevalonate decarboxylase